MKYEHKAIIDAANRDGKLPCEVAKELIGHDLLKAMVTCVSGHAVAFSKMSQQQQDAAIHDMQAGVTSAIDTAVRVISSQNTRTVRMKLKKVAIGKKWQIVGEAEGDEEFLHELADKTQDQSDVLVVLHERDYLQGLDAIQGEKDQKALPLDGEATGKAKTTKRAPKANTVTEAKSAGAIAEKLIELPAGLVEQAAEFVRKFQTATHAGLQNHLKIGFEKAGALLDRLEADCLITAQDEHGIRQLVRVAAEPKDLPAAKPEPVHGLDADADGFTVMSDELYARAKAKVITDQKVSAGGLAITFDLDDAVSAQLVDRLELEGVISEANDLGGREVFEQPEVA